MTTNPTDDQIVDEATRILDLRISEAKAFIEHAERSRREQPERLAKARSDAEEARGWSLIEEPFAEQCQPMQSTNGDTTLTMPNTTAKELWGSRLAFDLLDCGDDWDKVDTVLTRMFSAANGDTGLAFLLATSALSTIATVIVPELLNEIEQRGSNYDMRVRLAEARTKSWHGRVSDIRKLDEEAERDGIKGIDGFDIASNALDDEDGEPW